MGIGKSLLGALGSGALILTLGEQLGRAVYQVLPSLKNCLRGIKCNQQKSSKWRAAVAARIRAMHVKAAAHADAD